VIVLRGPANVGKTTTIKKAYDLLKSKYPNAVRGRTARVGIEFIGTLTIHGVRVAFETQGDPSTELELRLSPYVRMECEIIVCATRMWGETVDAVKKLEPNYKVIWLRQVRSDPGGQESSNLAMAQKVIEHVEESIKRAA
jgi:hypothetical protein